MRKTGVIAALVLVLGSIGGCGTGDENADDPQWKMEDTDSSDMPEGAAESDSSDRAEEISGSDNTGQSIEDGKIMQEGVSDYAALVEGLIESQSFETELDGWGSVFFASAAPAGEKEEPYFMLLKDKEVVYTFPKTVRRAEEKFVEVSAVAFQDYNQDGKKDVIVLAAYDNGGSRRTVPEIFLQENTDNMFYLDHPDLESYRVEAAAENGGGFYRDTFLEEYLSGQGLTDSIADLADSWIRYVEYADSLSGSLSNDQQIEIFAKNRETWAAGMDYANERHRFTLANLGYDGKITLIVSNQGGTGNYTYSEFYQIDGNGELKKLDTSFREGDSQPDLMEETMAVYTSFSDSGMRNYFIVRDMMRDGPNYLYRVSSLCLQDDFVLETPLASQRVLYEGEGEISQITGEDCRGNELTEEEYERFADTYYSEMGMSKQTAAFEWIDVNSLKGVSGEEAEKILRRAYEGFSLN